MRLTKLINASAATIRQQPKLYPKYLGIGFMVFSLPVIYVLMVITLPVFLVGYWFVHRGDECGGTTPSES